MKHFISFRGLATTLLLVCCNAVWAYDIEVDGIYYNITSATNFTAEVASRTYLAPDDIVIPSTITYKSRTFTVTSIGYEAFRDDDIRSIKLPNSITIIGYAAFNNCDYLKSIELPNNITSIEVGAFANCDGLTSVKLPNSVTTIGGYAFWNCRNLKSVELPNNITSIEYCTFRECIRLTRIVIPKSVQQIGNSAFEDCKALKSIYVMAETPPSVSSSSFDAIHFMDAVLYVPNGCLEAYQNAEVWKEFWDIREFDLTGIGDVKADNENATTVYDLNGRVVENPTKGIYIINGKKVLLK